MGFGISKQVTLNDRHTHFSRSGSIVFSKEDSETVLKFETPGTYLLYRDYDTDRLYLSVRSHHYVEHHRINFEDNLYYMDNQPYPYLDSIILYHRKHKLNGTKLTHHAHLSARTVKLFTLKVTAQNGNIPDRESKTKKQLASASFGAYDHNHVVKEYTNDMVLQSNRISKSSGRLWRAGMHESFKRFSMPETIASLKSFGNETESNHVTANGHVPGISKSSDDIDDELEGLFDLDDEFDGGGGPLTSRSALSEPDILYCSHL